MKGLPEGSVDLVVTDPPYGYSFMGKDWDRAVPDVDVWRECHRVLKAGAFAFVMSSPRQDVLSQMIVRLGQAGFETGFTSIYWAYASGFPKAMNISKMVDKRNGRHPEQYKELGKYLRERRGNRPQKDLAKFFPSVTGGLTGCVANWELGFNVPTKEQWKILKRELNLDDRFDDLIEREEAEREIIGKDGRTAKISMFNIGIQPEWSITKSATEQAKVLDGSYGGFQPKPSLEVILVCMKPLSEKTFVDQALKNQKGITWLDNARIPYQNECDEYHRENTTQSINIFTGSKPINRNSDSKGRFPANLLVSDDVLNDGTNHASGHMDSVASRTNRLTYGRYADNEVGRTVYSRGDSGSFSRYFDLDKWFSKAIPENVRKTFPFLICPKTSKAERNQGLEGLPICEVQTHGESKPDINGTSHNTTGQKPAHRQNFHPTVKPLKLMSYLITLGSRPNDVVLDPFVGSGTTCLAAELLNRKWIGIDVNSEYCLIAEKRLSVIPKKLLSFQIADGLGDDYSS